MTSRRPPALAVATALVIMVIGVIVAWQLHLVERTAAIAGIDTVIVQANEQLDQQIGMLEAVAGLAEELPSFDRPAFEQMVARVSGDGRGRGMQGIGYAVLHPVAATDAMIAAVSRRYGVRAVAPATDQPVRATIVMLAPDSAANRAALGFDMYAESRRRAAMQRAARTGAPAASAIVTLVQERATDAAQPGFLIYIPVRGPTGAVSAYVYAPYRAHDLLGSLFGDSAGHGRGFGVHTGSAGNGADAVWRLGMTDGPRVRRQLQIADQRWIVDSYDPRLGFFNGMPALILMGSGLAALLVGALLTALARRAEGLAFLAEERAGRAHDKDVLLAEMAHRLKNSYARIAALISMTAREHDSVATFAPALRGRVHALADSVALITAGAGGAALLADLLAAELRRARPDLVIEDITDGPALLLAEQEAHAIGLILHELATNSIKYGALGGNGTLGIRWTSLDGEAHLTWTERDLDPPPVIGAEGFGSQFLRTIVTRQLRGSINRQADGSTLVVDLHWPQQGIAGGA